MSTEEGISLFREALGKLEELKDEGLKGFCVTSALTGEYLAAEFSAYIDKEEFSKNVGSLIKFAENLCFDVEGKENGREQEAESSEEFDNIINYYRYLLSKYRLSRIEREALQDIGRGLYTLL